MAPSLASLKDFQPTLASTTTAPLDGPARGTQPRRRRRDEIGEDDIDRNVERLERVRAGKRGERRCREYEAVGRVGAVVVNAAAAHRLHAAFTGECNFDIPDLVALLRCRDEMLAAVLDPLDRPFSRERCKRDGE